MLALPTGLLISPKGMAIEALPWLCAMLLGALAVTRLRLALVWLLLTAICIGFVIFIPIGIASQSYRMVDNPGSWVRVAYVMIITGFSLFFLWRRETMIWMRESGGKLSMAVF
ncbi:hypothetical protein EKN06_01015 [Croceicoccus ponticola]|uniref:Uncharacterized protein n=1 Tax=Croceicoccus ponticola TaxID=2217664 RepID=A0A437GZP1_9SPHN|nr:hypothetical protein EKN06_01015 [Croceicoccus ponticola]